MKIPEDPEIHGDSIGGRDNRGNVKLSLVNRYYLAGSHFCLSSVQASGVYT